MLKEAFGSLAAILGFPAEKKESPAKKSINLVTKSGHKLEMIEPPPSKLEDTIDKMPEAKIFQGAQQSYGSLATGYVNVDNGLTNPTSPWPTLQNPYTPDSEKLQKLVEERDGKIKQLEGTYASDTERKNKQLERACERERYHIAEISKLMDENRILKEVHVDHVDHVEEVACQRKNISVVQTERDNLEIKVKNMQSEIEGWKSHSDLLKGTEKNAIERCGQLAEELSKAKSDLQKTKDGIAATITDLQRQLREQRDLTTTRTEERDLYLRENKELRQKVTQTSAETFIHNARPKEASEAPKDSESKQAQFLTDLSRICGGKNV